MGRGQKNLKQYRKKRRLRLLYKVLSFVLIVAALITGSVLFFQVEEIQVSGSSKYSNEQILSIAAVDQNANLLLLPEGAISERITDSLPYVDKVKLKRSFPTTLNIVIEECIPLAAVQVDGNWYVLDENGKILERTDESIAGGYIQLSGLSLTEPKVGEVAKVSQDDTHRLKGLCGLLTALQENAVYSNVSWIDMSSDTEIEMGYLGRFTVYLPIRTEYSDATHNNEEYNRKIIELKQIASLLDEADKGIIDLRHENGYFRPG
ncbi:MAG: Cell division protein FtsQ [Evtepia sp.]|jgi:cell division protein FtsQ|nr:Cell division protein FtsQ [Evtepia sp.]